MSTEYCESAATTAVDSVPQLQISGVPRAPQALMSGFRHAPVTQAVYQPMAVSNLHGAFTTLAVHSWRVKLEATHAPRGRHNIPKPIYMWQHSGAVIKSRRSRGCGYQSLLYVDKHVNLTILVVASCSALSKGWLKPEQQQSA